MTLIIAVSVILQFLIVFYALKFRDFREESLTWIAVASGFFILALWNSLNLLQIFLRTFTRPIDPVSELITFAFSGFVFGGLFTLSKKEASQLDSAGEDLLSNIKNTSSFFQSMPFPMIVVDKESSLILAANKASSELLGYPIKEIVGSPNSIIYPPESKRQYNEIFYGKISDEKDSIFEIFLINKGGERIPVKVTAIASLIDKRELFYFIYKDATDSDKVERDLEYHTMLLDKVTDTIIAHDFSGNIIYANEAAYKTRGYIKEEFLALNLNDLITEDNSNEFPKRIRKILDTGPFIFRSTHRHKDGKLFPVEVNPKLIEHENGKAIVSVIRDMTEQIKIETDAEFKSFLTDEINDSIFVHDFEGNIEFINKMAYENLGYTKEELLAMNIMDLVTPEHEKQLNSNFNKIMDQGFLDVSAINYRKDKSAVHCEVRAKVIDYKGKKAIASVVRDVTEQKNIEIEAIFKSNLIDEIKDSVFVHDLEGNFLYINEAAYKDRGYTKDELMALNLANLVTPDIKTKLKLNFDKILEKGFLSLESKHYKKDGTIINCQVNAKVITYKGQKTIASVVRDVGELNLLSMLAESANDSIFVHNNKTIFYANEVAYSSRGYSREEFLALPIKELLEEEQKNLLDSRWSDSLASNEDLDFESVHRKKDGTTFPVEVRSKIIEYKGEKAALSISRDISSHYAALDAIEASKENYRQLSEATDDDVLIIDNNFTFTYINNTAAKRFNLKQDNFIGKNIVDVLPPHFAEEVISRVKSVLDSNEIKIFEAEIPADGKNIFLNTKMIPLNDESGNVKSVLTVARDFKDMKNAELEARQAENKYQALISLANDAVFVADATTGILIDANKSAEKLIKRPVESIIGMNQMELHPPEEADNYRRIFKEYVEKNQGVIGGIFAIDSAGNKIPIEISSSVMEINNKPVVMGIFRDVSLRTRTNELNETLNDINSTIHSHLEIDERLKRILKISANKINSRSAIILIRGNDSWSVSDAYKAGSIKIGTRLSDVDAKCAAYIAANKEALAVDDIETEPLANVEFLKALGAKSFYAVPLIIKGKIIGILDFYFDASPLPIDQAERDFIVKLAASTALAIENASLYDTEAGIANTLQEALLKMPEHIHGGIFGNVYRSASKAARVGGDFYDIFELEHNKIGIIIGDVSGKGLGAASLTTLIKNSIRAASYDHDNPSTVISKVNDIVTNMTDEYMFVTVFFAIVEVVTGELTYCLAGHPPPIIRRVSREIDYLSITSPPVGVMKGLEFKNGSSNLSKGDVLINYTDGLLETRSGDDFFGEARLEQLINNSAEFSVKELPHIILKEVEKFSNHKLTDDTAILTFQINHYK